MTTIFTHTPRAPLIVETGIRQHWYTHDGKFISATKSARERVRITAMRFADNPVAELEMYTENQALRDFSMKTCVFLNADALRELARCLVDAAHDIETRPVDA